MSDHSVEGFGSDDEGDVMLGELSASEDAEDSDSATFVVAQRDHFFRHLPGVEVVSKREVLKGYELYIVQEWIWNIRRQVKVLMVPSKNPESSVVVAVLHRTPGLRKDMRAFVDSLFIKPSYRGVQADQTPLGTVIATPSSVLLRLRTMLTIISVPDGDFDKVYPLIRVQLSMRRLGCERVPVSIEGIPPRLDAAFRAMYHPSQTEPTADAVKRIVSRIQAGLRQLHFLMLLSQTDGVYGNFTVVAARMFQTQVMGLQSTSGEGSPAMLDALEAALKLLGSQLKTLGFDWPDDPMDVEHGGHESAMAAVKAFQESKSKLIVDGLLGRKTRELLAESASEHPAPTEPESAPSPPITPTPRTNLAEVALAALRAKREEEARRQASSVLDDEEVELLARMSGSAPTATKRRSIGESDDLIPDEKEGEAKDGKSRWKSAVAKASEVSFAAEQRRRAAFEKEKKELRQAIADHLREERRSEEALSQRIDRLERHVATQRSTSESIRADLTSVLRQAESLTKDGETSARIVTDVQVKMEAMDSVNERLSYSLREIRQKGDDLADLVDTARLQARHVEDKVDELNHRLQGSFYDYLFRALGLVLAGVSAMLFGLGFVKSKVAFWKRDPPKDPPLALQPSSNESATPVLIRAGKASSKSLAMASNGLRQSGNFGRASLSSAKPATWSSQPQLATEQPPTPAATEIAPPTVDSVVEPPPPASPAINPIEDEDDPMPLLPSHSTHMIRKKRG